MFPRSSGILLHITSLPSPYGIGTMGDGARAFVDFLHAAGQSWWQILPLVPTGEGNSPYMSPSSAAGNPWLIDPELLAREGLLTQDELGGAKQDHPDRVDYDFLNRTRIPLLRQAFARRSPKQASEAAAFSARHSDWLPDYALFMACQEQFHAPFYDWPDKDLIHRKPAALEHWRKELSEEVEFHTFLQYLFFRQWHALKQYANEKGVGIIGDIPFYVSDNSVDVWCHPELFQVDQDCHAKLVAGVPPDLFSDEGQFWGNPLYNWPRHAEDGYSWWCRRIRQSMDFYDVIRIDHFRGFDSYWEIPRTAKSAKEGYWRAGPGQKWLDAVQTQVPEAKFIAEDLGDLTPSAIEFIQNSGLPGMRVLTDAFNDLSGGSSFLPHRCVPGAVIYTGTHDTPTFVEWLFSIANEDQRHYAMDYLRLRDDEGYGWGVICGAWSSVCELAMAPFQDVLGLGGDARMNLPGSMGGQNWSWRVRREAFNQNVADHLRHITGLYGRLR